MKGRTPKPPEVREREGNAGKRPIRRSHRARGGLTRPADLHGPAAALWDEFVPELERLGIVDPTDAAALKAMCVQWGVAETTRLVVDEEGYFASGSMGQIVEHPGVKMMQQAYNQFLRYAEQFGMTAAARARVAAAGGPEEPEVPFADKIGTSPRLRAVQ